MKPQLNFKLFAKGLLAAAIVFAGIIGGRAEAQISTATITVNDTSVAATGISASDTTPCSGSLTTLSVVGGELADGAQWTWYDTDPSTGSPAAVHTGATYSVSPTADITYYVRAEGGTSCANTTTAASFDLTVNPLPTLAIADTAFCNGVSATLATTGTADSFVYTGGSGIGLADGDGNSISFTSSASGASMITETVTVTPYLNGCIGNNETVDVSVIPTINVTVMNDTTVCSGGTVAAADFSSSVTSPAATFAWTNDVTSIGLAASGSGEYGSFTATNTGTDNDVATIEVTASVTSGGTTCTGTDNYTITVRPEPNGTIAATGPVCEGEPIPLQFTPTAGSTMTGVTWTLSINGSTTSATGAVDYTTATLVGEGDAVNITGLPAATSGDTDFGLWKIEDNHGCVNE